MPTGNVPLLEAAKSGDNMLKQGVVEVMIQENPWLELLPWLPFAGNALQHQEEGTLPDVQFRNVNEGYTSSWGSDNSHFWGVAILGGEIKVDRFLVNVVGTRESIEAKQWKKLAKSNAMRFGFEALNGTGSVASKGFKGIYALVEEGFGQKLHNNTTGNTGAVVSLDKIDEAMDLFKNQGLPDAGLLNRTVRRAITRAARNTHSGISLIDVGTDVFGRQVTKYNDVPLRILGDVRNGSGATVDSLPFTEHATGVGSGTSTSILWIKFSEDDVTGLLGQNGVMYVESFGEMQALPQRLGRMEWYPGLAIFNKYAVVRQHGITVS
jgi:hypothetical protein